MNMMEFGFKQHLTYVIHVVQQKKKKKHLPASAGSLNWKKRPRVRGNKQFFNCGLRGKNNRTVKIHRKF
jgi:hypothetical protein